MPEKKRVWISWEQHRRSAVLAKHFHFDLFEITSKKRNLYRYIECIRKTFSLLFHEKPDILVVQNPSLVLALIALALKPIFRYKLIVDRHTNFKLNTRNSYNIKWLLFHCISNHTLKYSDLTIVTNSGLRRIVRRKGGRAFTLPDKLPDISVTTKSSLIKNDTKANLLCVCSFADDEPIEELLEAMEKFSGELNLYVTGNWRKKYTAGQIEKLKPNVILTGFINDSEFTSLMAEADGIIILTKNEFTLNCGAYEALSLNKPIMLSNTLALRSYFGTLAIYSDVASSKNIEVSLKEFMTFINTDSHKRKQQITLLHKCWLNQADRLDDLIRTSL